MKRILFIIILFFLFGKIVLGQPDNNTNWSTITVEEAFRPKMPKQIDTLYYPFYNGVQMIEIDHIGFWDKKIYFLEQSNPRAMPHSYYHPMPIGNEFFFRDITGTIVKTFNSELNLNELNKHFKKIPTNKKHKLSNFFPYHSSQDYRSNGIWPYSPNFLFHFQGHYKVSNSTAKQVNKFSTEFRDIQEIKFGLIDSLGSIKLPIEYDEIIPWYGNLLVQKDKKWGILNYNQEVVVPLKYDRYDTDAYSGSVYPDKMRNIFFLSVKKEENYKTLSTYDAVFFSSKNKLIPLDNYDEIFFEGGWNPLPYEDYSKRVLRFKKNDKIGALNADYEEILKPQFDIFNYDKNDLFRVSKKGKFGFWDKNFKEIIPLEYDFVQYFDSDSTSLVLKNGEFYCINKQGKRQPKCKSKPVWSESHLGFIIDKNYIRVEVQGVFGILDTLSKSIILPIKYKLNSEHQFRLDEINSFLDRNKVVFSQKKLEHKSSPDIYDEILFHKNKIIVKNNKNRYGVVDTTFNVLIDFKYDKLEVVQYNLKYLIYSHKGKSGVMNFSGEDILTSKYDEIRYNMQREEERDIFQVRQKNKWGVVDFENKTLVPCEYDSISFLGHWGRPRTKLWIVEKNQKFGVVNYKNEIFIPFEYDGISHLSGNTLWVEDKDKNRYKVELSDIRN